MPFLGVVLSLYFLSLVRGRSRQQTALRYPIWIFSLLMFAVSTFLEFSSELSGQWPIGVYKAYYVSIAWLVLSAGAGAFLLTGLRGAARAVLALSVVAGAALLVLAVSANITTVDLGLGKAAVKTSVMPKPAVAVFAASMALGSLAGGLGGLYSAWKAGSWTNLLVPVGMYLIPVTEKASVPVAYVGAIVGMAIFSLGYLSARPVRSR